MSDKNKTPDDCTHDCSACGSDCASKTKAPEHAKLNAAARVGKVIAVMSGKGGVGKSLITSMLAAEVQKAGYRAAILDADITGPSIPKAFGIKGRASGNTYGIIPSKSASGVQIMSINLLLQNETDPVIWRGAMIAGAVQQLWTDVVWDDVDYMFVDMPPGTGDIPLTVFQQLPVSGIVLVTSPQELVSMIVGKAAKMADMMKIKILGIVENMSYFVCPDCGKKYNIFGESKLAASLLAYGIKTAAALPLDPSFAAGIDSGKVESISGILAPFAKQIIEQV